MNKSSTFTPGPPATDRGLRTLLSQTLFILVVATALELLVFLALRVKAIVAYAPQSPLSVILGCILWGVALGWAAHRCGSAKFVGAAPNAANEQSRTKWPWVQKCSSSSRAWADAPHSLAVTRKVCQAMGISTPAVYVSAAIDDARVTTPKGAPVILAPKSLEWVARLHPERAACVIAHELAHIANGDVRRANVATVTAVFVAVVAALVLCVDCTIQMVAYAGAIAQYGPHSFGESQGHRAFATLFGLFPYLLNLALAYAAFLRMREFEADCQVRVLGLGEHLYAALQGARVRHHTVWRFHPTASERCQALMRSHGGDHVDAWTVAIVAMLQRLSIDLAMSVGGGLRSGMPVFFLVTALSVAVVGTMGLCIGKQATVDDKPLWGRAKEIGRCVLLFWVGIAVAEVVVGLNQFTPEAPLTLQLWEVLVQTLTQPMPLALSFAAAYLIGSSMSHERPPRGFARLVWMLIGCALPWYVYICGTLSTLFIDPHGISPSTKYSAMMEELHRQLTQAFPAIPSVDELYTSYHLSFPEVAINVGGVLLGGLIGLVAACCLLRWLWPRLSPPLHGRAWVQSGLAAGLLLSTAASAALATSVAASIATEVRTARTLWLTCRDERTGTDALASWQISKGFVDYVGEHLMQVQSFAPGFYIGMGHTRCNLHVLDRYPSMRRLMALMNLIDDAFAEVIFDERNVVILYRPDASAAGELIYRGSMLEPAAAATALLQAHAPYRVARGLQQNLPWGSLEVDRALMAVMSARQPLERAWAHNAYGYARYIKEPTVAEIHLNEALRLDPGNATFQANMAFLLISRSRCQQARAHVMAAESLSSGPGSAQLAAAQARCLANEGHAQEAVEMLWKLRGALKQSPVYWAALGEVSLRANHHALARDSFAQAVELSSNVPPPACARLFNALYQRPEVCDASRCRAPVDSMNPEERQCWAMYVARYGHAVAP